MSEQAQERNRERADPDGRTARLSPDVHRRLLTIQFERKMAGEVWSFSDIIRELLDRAGAA